VGETTGRIISAVTLATDLI